MLEPRICEVAYLIKRVAVSNEIMPVFVGQPVQGISGQKISVGLEISACLICEQEIARGRWTESQREDRHRPTTPAIKVRLSGRVST